MDLHRDLRRLMHPAVVVDGAATVQEAVAAITSAGGTAVLVRPAPDNPDSPDGAGAAGAGRYGICTDRDIRSRLLAAGLPPSTPVREIATAEAVAIDPGCDVADALLLMVENGFRHLPVIDRLGEVLGVVEDVDLLAVQSHTPLHLRRAVTRADDEPTLVALARRLPGAWIDAANAGLDAVHVSAAMSATIEAITRRAVELAVAEQPPTAPVGWLLLGSLGRREAMPASDLDSALVWTGADDDPGRRAEVAALTRQVHGMLEAGGLSEDDMGLAAGDLRVARSAGAWRAAIARWLDHAGEPDPVVYLGALCDARAAYGDEVAAPVLRDLLARGGPGPATRRLGFAALAAQPPRGVLHGGLHRGLHGGAIGRLGSLLGADRPATVDLKQDGVAPITQLARWVAFAAGSAALGTLARLAAGRDAQVISAEAHDVLAEAFGALQDARLRQQVGRLEAGLPPTDEVAVASLRPLRRRRLEELFRAVADVQDEVRASLADARGLF